jgi:hypothetical protein
VLKGEDFKQYVNLLREKSLSYKQKRADLSDLKAEYGVLERTLEVLKYVYSFSFKLKGQSRENKSERIRGPRAYRGGLEVCINF